VLELHGHPASPGYTYVLLHKNWLMQCRQKESVIDQMTDFFLYYNLKIKTNEHFLVL